MNTCERLRRFLAQALEIPEATITPGTPIAALLRSNRDVPPDSHALPAIDSLDLVELLIAFEESEFGIDTPENDAERWLEALRTSTVQEFADFLDGR
jgi:acyl carrier protein